MKNIDVYRQMSAVELAPLLIQTVYDEDWDYNWDEELEFWGYNKYYVASDGEEYDDRDAAIAHEIWWLEQLADEQPFREPDGGVNDIGCKLK